MKEFIEQAEHNQDFHDCIHDKFNTRFFDWKIISIFYIAIHYLKALASHRGIDIGGTHYEIERNVNPKRDNPKMRITETAWRNYKRLFDYSCTARYQGIADILVFETLMEKDYKECLKHLKDFKLYIEGQGVVIPQKSSKPKLEIPTPITKSPAAHAKNN